MADYIDREALIERLTRNLNACNPGTFSERCYQDAINTVTFFPAADVALVVRCKDCEFVEACSIREAMECTDENGFCWRAERRCENGCP